jgi:hypothetical protein
MTQTIDKFLVDHGFEEQELKDIKYRSVLYHAILLMSAFTITFTGLAIAAWT